MGYTDTLPDSITRREVRKALRRTRIYAGLQARVARRLKVSRVQASKAASGRFPGRYRRVELALLEELARREPGVERLVKHLRAEQEARKNGGRP